MEFELFSIIELQNLVLFSTLYQTEDLNIMLKIRSFLVFFSTLDTHLVLFTLSGQMAFLKHKTEILAYISV